MKRFLFLAAALPLLSGCFLTAAIDKSFNKVTVTDQPAISEQAKALHAKLLVADLHADSLMWNRAVDERNTRGHVDFPRMIEGNLGLQAFTIVSKVPIGINVDSNSDKTDMITALVVAQGWPTETWSSLSNRVVYQTHKMRDAAARSKGMFTLVTTATDLRNYLERRKTEPKIIAGFLGIEGAHALEGKLSNLDVFYDNGVRMVAPTHFFDTDLGGSAHGEVKGGLTDFGKKWVARMEEKRMTIDLAHASGPVIDDVLDLAKRPVLVSHTGVKGTCDNNRNLTDKSLKRIAANGGVIGIAFFEVATCGKDVASIVKAIKYTTDLVGVDYVGLGSDYDGMVATPFDASGMAVMTDALLKAGYSEEDVAKIMGGNVVRVLLANLPD